MKVKYLKLTPSKLKLPQASELNFFSRTNDTLNCEQAANTCTRCGACLQRCPSFKALKSELYSPRGRAQLLRFIFERKISLKQDRKDILNTSLSCLMCGACTDFCPARTPVAGLMLSLNNALIKKKKLKFPFFRKALYLPAAKIKIALAEKKQTEVNKEIVLLPSFYASSQIKNTFKILNDKGFKARAEYSAMGLEAAYFSADIKKIKKILTKILQALEGSKEAVAESLETYAVLKKAVLFGAEFEPIAKNVKFITEYMRPSENIKEDIPFKKVLVYKNLIAPQEYNPADEINKFLICRKKLFLIECIQSKDLPPAAAAHWVKTKAEKQIRQDIARTLSGIGADCIITASHTDKMLFKKALKGVNPQPAVLHLTQISEYFYGKDKNTNAERKG